MTEARFAINHAEISFNHFDDEIIVIHLQSGLYFSLRETAALLWRGLEQGVGSAESLSAVFNHASADTEEKVGQFLNQLAKAGLVTPTADPVSASVPVVAGSTAFSAPTLETYDDLQELLLADIVHDTDENGWPNLAVQEPNNGNSHAA